MIVYGDPETWGMKVDQFLDSRRLERESFADGTNPKIKMILDMLRRGMDVDTISTITGATIEEINSVAKKAKPISTEKPVGPEEGISKNKTYSEIDILSNIEAKFPGGNTRDDIVYNPMPNPVPRMDEYMPEFEGLEDPRYRQSELADGGIVEREGFANGKKLKPYGMTSYEMDQARIDNLNFEIEKRNKLGVKTIAPQLEKSTGYERANINKLIQKGRVTRPLSKEELVTQYINKAIAENKTIGEMTKKAIGDYISADLPKGSKGRLENHTTAKIIKKQFPELFKTLYTKNSGALDQLARNTDLLDIPINDFIKEPTKIRRERSESTIRKGQNTARLRILQGKIKIRSKRFCSIRGSR
jgi:hypothetical protein